MVSKDIQSLQHWEKYRSRMFVIEKIHDAKPLKSVVVDIPHKEVNRMLIVDQIVDMNKVIVSMNEVGNFMIVMNQKQSFVIMSKFTFNA